MNIATDCQYCAQDGGKIWDVELIRHPPSGDYWVAAGCLKKLHTRVFLVCARHLAVFSEMYQQIPCGDCGMEPGKEISYLSEVLWEKRNPDPADPAQKVRKWEET